MIIRKKSFLASITVLLMILSLVLLTTKGFAQEDNTPPILHELTVSSNEIKPGEKVKISADVTDDLSEIGHVFVTYQSPYEIDKKINKSVTLAYNNTTGKYEGSFEIGQYDIEGEWIINYISISDRHSNSYVYFNETFPESGSTNPYGFRDFNDYSINVHGTLTDVTPPTLNSVAVSSNEITFDGEVKISVDVTDDVSGVKYVQIRYSNYPSRPWYLTQSLGYNPATGKYEGTYTIDERYRVGTISTLNSIEVIDIQGNRYGYAHSKTSTEKTTGGEYRDLSNYNIAIVSSDPSDQTKPVTNIKVQSSSSKFNGWYSSNVNISLDASDDKSGVLRTLYIINKGVPWLTKYTKAIELQNEGVYTIEYMSIDRAGNEEEMKNKVIKIDKTAPTLHVSFDQSVITDRNHKLVPINASIEAHDNLSGISSFELVSIVSNQQDNGKGDGNTNQDIQDAKFGTPDTHFLLRAERSGSKDRIYTVTYKAVNNAGKTVTTSQDIVVKHNKSKEKK